MATIDNGVLDFIHDEEEKLFEHSNNVKIIEDDEEQEEEEEYTWEEEEEEEEEHRNMPTTTQKGHTAVLNVGQTTDSKVELMWNVIVVSTTLYHLKCFKEDNHFMKKYVSPWSIRLSSKTTSPLDNIWQLKELTHLLHCFTPFSFHEHDRMEAFTPSCNSCIDHVPNSIFYSHNNTYNTILCLKTSVKRTHVITNTICCLYFFYLSLLNHPSKVADICSEPFLLLDIIYRNPIDILHRLRYSIQDYYNKPTHDMYNHFFNVTDWDLKGTICECIQKHDCSK